MDSGKRPFRTPASYQAERITRDAVVPFLQDRGLRVTEELRRAVGPGESQIVAAQWPDGRQARMRVRLCWRRDGRNPRENLYSAFQLRARTLDGDWDRTLESIAGRDAREGVTHTLALQRQGHEIVFAALIPSDQLPALWRRQRDISDELIAQGAMGKVRKNHAANGDSPTLWLHDLRGKAAHRVPDALWAWPGVQDLAKLPLADDGPSQASGVADDSWDDMPGVDYRQLGSDGAPRRSTWRSSVRRDPKVRAEVVARSKGRCERVSCGAGRDYPGFLDVHHILGAEKGDRYWNCVALCPNCHREAHFAPDADAINAELLAFAGRFAPCKASA